MIEDKIEMDNFSILNYKAIELLVQLNCLKPSEKLIYKAESLLRSLFGEDEKTSPVFRGQPHNVAYKH